MYSEKTIKDLKRQLKLNILRSNELLGYEKERNNISDLLKKTVEYGESNSALIIGPRGTGKTTMVNSIVHEQLESNTNTNDLCCIVRLNGLVHTDDKLALKSITMQMNLDNFVDGKVFGSFAENLTFLLACLKAGNKDNSKSVIFLLEEFDLFCAHHNQTLLYNLFDTSQNAQTPVCILGITCRLDVIELFEKRVKSRFSHRQIFIFFEENLENRLKTIQNYLLLEEKSFLTKKIVDDWNRHIKTLINNKSFHSFLQQLMNSNLTLQSLKNMLLTVLFQLNSQNPKLKLDMFEQYLKDMYKDDTVAVLEGLSALEMCLVVALKHHVEIYDNQPFNFEMIFTRYMKFTEANATVQAVPRPVVMKAFEHLTNIELITPHSGMFKLQKDYQPFRLNLITDQIIEAVKNVPHLPTEIIQWAHSSLI